MMSGATEFRFFFDFFGPSISRRVSPRFHSHSLHLTHVELLMHGPKMTGKIPESNLMRDIQMSSQSLRYLARLRLLKIAPSSSEIYTIWNNLK